MTDVLIAVSMIVYLRSMRTGFPWFVGIISDVVVLDFTIAMRLGRIRHSDC